MNRILTAAFVFLSGSLAATTADASCLDTTFGGYGQNGYFYIHDSPAAASTQASIVGHFWSPGNYESTGEQGCDDSHWLSHLGIDTQTWTAYGTLGQMNCTSGCPSGEMIITLEDKSTDGTGAFFQALRVTETPANPQFDFSRVGTNMNLVPIPTPLIVSSTTGEVFQARFAVPDPAAGFYGLPGVPASGTITAFWMYTRDVPSPRNRDAWRFVGRFPYTGGTTLGTVTLVCPNVATFLAAAIEFDNGEVVTTYVSGGAYVDCDTYAPGAGAVRDGGANGLFASRDINGDVKLTWGHSCSAGDTDYEIYEGTIGDWTSHRPRVCTTSGARTATFTPPPENAYYLVVTAENEYEGSYGGATAGERPLGVSWCRSRLVNACPP